MAQNYPMVYPHQFHRFFPGISPCTCDQDSKNTIVFYRVETQTGNKYYHGPIIEKVKIKCWICEEEEVFEVVEKNIYENDFKF